MIKPIGIPFRIETWNSAEKLYWLYEQITSWTTALDREQLNEKIFCFCDAVSNMLEQIDSYLDMNGGRLSTSKTENIWQQNEKLNKYPEKLASCSYTDYIHRCKDGTAGVFNSYRNLINSQNLFFAANVNFVNLDTTYQTLVKSDYQLILPRRVQEDWVSALTSFSALQWDAGSFLIFRAGEVMIRRYYDLIFKDSKPSKDFKQPKLETIIQKIEKRNIFGGNCYKLRNFQAKRNDVVHPNKYSKPISEMEAEY